MLSNWTHETSTSTGTGNFTLSGAATDMRTIASQFALGERFSAQIVHVGAAELEAGIYYLSDSVTLVRETVLDSSNGGALVSFTAGTKQVFVADTTLQKLRSQSGYYHQSAHLLDTGAGSKNSLNGNRITWQPHFWQFNNLVDSISIKCTTVGGAGSVGRLAIKEDKNGLPEGATIFESENFDLSTTGLKEHIFTTPIDVRNRMIWIGWATDNSTSQFAASDGSIIPCTLGTDGASTATFSYDMVIQTPEITDWGVAFPEITGIYTKTLNRSPFKILLRAA